MSVQSSDMRWTTLFIEFANCPIRTKRNCIGKIGASCVFYFQQQWCVHNLFYIIQNNEPSNIENSNLKKKKKQKVTK